MATRSQAREKSSPSYAPPGEKSGKKRQVAFEIIDTETAVSLLQV